MRQSIKFEIGHDPDNTVFLTLETIPELINFKELSFTIQSTINSDGKGGDDFKQHTSFSTMISINRLEKLIESLTFIKNEALKNNEK